MIVRFVTFLGLFLTLAANCQAQLSLDNALIDEIHWQRTKSVTEDGSYKPSVAENNTPDDVMREIALHSENLNISQTTNTIQFDLEMDRERTRFMLADRSSSSIGQVFAVDLERHVHGEIYLGHKVFYIRNISGIIVLAKLPVVSDEIHIRNLTLDLEEQVATVKARTLWSFIEIVARSNVALHTVDSVEWYAPLFRNLSTIFRSIRF